VRQIVVTGGGTGIGLAVARRFAETGEAVTITGRREHVLKATGLSYVSFDASDPDAIAGAMDRLPGKVDVLVNNAGRPSPDGRERPTTWRRPWHSSPHRRPVTSPAR
jgi:3-oxoacyl-[acyl-carrier protein] reductase